MTLGQRIKQIRVFKFGWSREALANQLGKKRPKCIQDWENGDSEPRLKTFIQLLAIFEISYDEFMKGVEID